MQGWKMREWINRYQTAGLENARQASMGGQKCCEQDVPLKSTLILKRAQQLLRWATAVGRTVGVAAVPFP